MTFENDIRTELAVEMALTMMKQSNYSLIKQLIPENNKALMKTFTSNDKRFHLL